MVKGFCLIVSGGDLSPVPDGFRGWDYLIACDKGYEYARQLGMEPELIVGDFDSAPEPAESENVRVFPSKKDDTDTMIAVKQALSEGYTEIGIVCALGGRLDHSFANIQAAAYAAEQGAKVRIIGASEEICVFSEGEETFPRREGWSLSVFSVSDVCMGVAIRGTEYDGEGIELTNRFPLGISNKWKDSTARISVRKGILMVMESRIPE